MKRIALAGGPGTDKTSLSRQLDEILETRIVLQRLAVPPTIATPPPGMPDEDYFRGLVKALTWNDETQKILWVGDRVYDYVRHLPSFKPSLWGTFDDFEVRCDPFTKNPDVLTIYSRGTDAHSHKYEAIFDWRYHS